MSMVSGITLNGKVCLVARTCSLITRICLSILGTCSLAAVVFRTIPSTVAQKSEGFSKKQIAQAKTARDFQTKVGHPSTQDLKSVIKLNLIANCPVTTADVDRAETIFGPSLPILKGKMTCQSPKSVQTDYVAVPDSILSANQHVTLFGDIFFINKVPFFVTVSDHLKFTTTEHIANRKVQQLVLASLHVKAIYAARDFKIKVMIMDGEFVPLKHDLTTATIIN
jgi:hypothetical protein